MSKKIEIVVKSPRMYERKNDVDGELDDKSNHQFVVDIINEILRLESPIPISVLIDRLYDSLKLDGKKLVGENAKKYLRKVVDGCQLKHSETIMGKDEIVLSNTLNSDYNILRDYNQLRRQYDITLLPKKEFENALTYWMQKNKEDITIDALNTLGYDSFDSDFEKSNVVKKTVGAIYENISKLIKPDDVEVAYNISYPDSKETESEHDVSGHIKPDHTGKMKFRDDFSMIHWFGSIENESSKIMCFTPGEYRNTRTIATTSEEYRDKHLTVNFYFVKNDNHIMEIVSKLKVIPGLRICEPLDNKIHSWNEKEKKYEYEHFSINKLRTESRCGYFAFEVKEGNPINIFLDVLRKIDRFEFEYYNWIADPRDLLMDRPNITYVDANEIAADNKV